MFLPLIDISYSCHCNRNQRIFFFVLNKFDLRIRNFKFNNSAVGVCAHCMLVAVCVCATTNQNQGGGPFYFFCLFFYFVVFMVPLSRAKLSSASLHCDKLCCQSSVPKCIARTTFIQTSHTHTGVYTGVNRKSCKGANELPLQLCPRCWRCHWHISPI